MTHSKTLLRSSIFILVLILTQPASGSFQNEPDDFRGIKWGKESYELQGFTKVSTQGSLDYYTKNNEEMTIGDARLEMVIYVFYENKFCGAVLNFKSPPNFKILKTMLFDRYGKGRQPNKYAEQYRWSGKKVIVTLEYDDITQKGKIKYFYMPIYSNKQKADQRRTR
jgi:hypothetical protein